MVNVRQSFLFTTLPLPEYDLHLIRKGKNLIPAILYHCIFDKMLSDKPDCTIVYTDRFLFHVVPGCVFVYDGKISEFQCIACLFVSALGVYI